MNDTPHYPKFEMSAKKWLEEHPDIEVSDEQLLHASERFYRINEDYYEEKFLAEQGVNPRHIDEITYEHTLRLQRLFDDTFGDGAFDDRHEIYRME